MFLFKERRLILKSSACLSVLVRSRSAERSKSYTVRRMTGHTCVVYGNSKAKDPNVTFHRIPKDAKRRARWLEVFDICEEVIKESTRVCCRHFPDGDCSKKPSISLGKRFASPRKKGPRAKRVRGEDRRELGRSVTPSLSSTSKSVTPTRPILSPTHQLETAAIGEQFVSDYSVYEFLFLLIILSQVNSHLWTHS